MNNKPTSKSYDRTLVIELGLILSLTLVILAFRWQSPLAQNRIVAHHDETMQMVSFDKAIEMRTLPKPAGSSQPVNTNKIDFSANDLQTANWPEAKTTEGKLPELTDEFIDTADVFVRGDEVFPQFPGGTPALMAYLAKNIRYNAQAIEFRITGKVYISFVVLPNGSIDDVRVVKGLGFGLDEEAIRVIKAMPRWQPGFQNGQPVAVAYHLPIQFSLR